MRARPSVRLTPEDKAAYAKWSRGVLGAWIVIVIATLTLPIFRSDSANITREQASDRAAAIR